jgi:hypothetical protein
MAQSYGFGGKTGGAENVYFQHFDIQTIPAVIRETTVPGIQGKIYKKLSLQYIRIIETGQCGKDTASLTALYFGKGNPATTQAVTTRLQGSYSNCYKVDATLAPDRTGVPEPNSTTGGRVRYRIIWEVTSLATGALGS